MTQFWNVVKLLNIKQQNLILIIWIIFNSQNYSNKMKFHSFLNIQQKFTQAITPKKKVLALDN